MTISEDYIVADFFSQRKNAIIEFIIKHPECTIREVETYCEKNQIGTKKTVDRYIKDLEREDKLTIKPSQIDKRALSLTIDSDNLLIYLPKDFDELFSLFQNFIIAIKEWIVTPEITFMKRFGKPEKKIDGQLITSKVIFLPFWTMDIINQIYTAFFIVVLPEKINKKEHIRKLNSLYHQYVSQIYALVYEEIGTYIPKLSRHLANKPIHYFTFTDTTIRPIDLLFRLINDCHAYSLQKELFNILNLVWGRNIDIAYDQYGAFGDTSDKFHCDRIDKSLLKDCNPKLRVIYRGIDNLMLIETNLENRPSFNYYYEDEFDEVWKQLTDPT